MKQSLSNILDSLGDGLKMGIVARKKLSKLIRNKVLKKYYQL